MKYIEVVFTQAKLDCTDSLKRYSFLTDSDVEVGDMFTAEKYTAPLQIVKVVNLDTLKHIIVSESENEEVIVKKIEL